MRNDFIQHSAKGSTWEDHKYTKKEGNRYYYSASNPSGISGDGLSKNLQETADSIEPEGFKDFKSKANFTIWSPNPEEESLVSKGQDVIGGLFKKDKKLMAKGGK